MVKEEWRPIKGYEDYEVSNHGRIYSHKRNKILQPLSNTKSYLHFEAYYGKGNRKIIKIHKAVYEAFIGDVPEGYDVHHKNFIRTDNMVENLECIEKMKHYELHHKKVTNGLAA